MKTKTNAMRMLDSANIQYGTCEYEVDEDDLSGVHLAESLGVDVSLVFKTLVARGERSGIHVLSFPPQRSLT